MTNAVDPGSEKDLPRGIDARAKVSAALACLQGARDQAAGLESIREVAANVLGSEEIAVFKVDKEKAVLWLYWCAGIDPNRYVCLDVMREPKLQSVLDGEIIVAGENSDEKLLSIQDPVSALIPIFVFDAVGAVIVIFRLLPQKAAFDAADRDVCRTLSIAAGRAIQPAAKIHHSEMKRDNKK
jgi:hypothetical protein